ncbi:50S ribosomal protein L17 [Candidatus Kaiserbacteria bacterium RIFCSPLOWO2_01_FULL_54_13]|uniref:50S ribosomal protein L17 n=1 Tax=Candidatus Kaiserbacteria bacterium RIFCSPLOWO2_01_FULL_54_13 TaxID=1798512 RepID=A0A1F6EZW2_9BACT|nr:MAG: 50S ribosomal protein L17 [Candidatus Kaiserbacteria bacterium RIFCSPLOWO2_01_FULL_54_13]
MRHHDRNRKFGRVKRQRVALLRSLARSLVLSEGIVTTEAKAKALRPFVERLITMGKKNTLSNRRLTTSRLGSNTAGSKLRELGARYAKRAGGYTRIVRLGRVGKRVGDMVRIELIR